MTILRVGQNVTRKTGLARLWLVPELLVIGCWVSLWTEMAGWRIPTVGIFSNLLWFDFRSANNLPPFVGLIRNQLGEICA
jgi:hypothetical protein